MISKHASIGADLPNRSVSLVDLMLHGCPVAVYNRQRVQPDGNLVTGEAKSAVQD